MDTPSLLCGLVQLNRGRSPHPCFGDQSARSNGATPPAPGTFTNVGYDGEDQPLWILRQGLFYPELDTIGNVRRLHSHSDPQHFGSPEQGPYFYSAFGKGVTASDPQGISSLSGDYSFGWQGKRAIGGALYYSRARIWCPDLGIFLQPDEYGFLTRTGTLWSWPRQNPFRWRDPTGRQEVEDDEEEDPFGDGLPGERLAPIPAGETNLQLEPDYPWVEELNRSLANPEPRAGGSNDPLVECKDEPPGRLPPGAGNYRGRYNADRASRGLPRLPSDFDAHHRIPQAYRDNPEFSGFDFDAPENIRGVEGSRGEVNVHQQITNQWSEFQSLHPDAPRSQIEAFADAIDLFYGL